MAQDRGAEWRRVDFDDDLEPLYRSCRFRSARAGLIDLTGRQS